MNNLSKIKNLYAYEDGDTITPRMGVQIASGKGLQQFYLAETRQVTNTDFVTNHPTLFPQPYSGRAGDVVVPASGGQWYLNNISDNNGILDAGGSVKSAFSDTFETTTVTMNGKTFPALTIKKNLVLPTNSVTTDIYIYYQGTYNGKQFICEQCIPVQAVVSNAYQLLVSASGPNGIAGDEVLSDDNDWIQYAASLQLMSTGTDVGVSVTFQRFGSSGWENVTNQTGYTEISGNTLKVFPAAVDGQELFRAVAVYNGKTYYKTFEPTDVHDPYYIVDGCSIAGDTVKSGETASFSPKVYMRHNGHGEEDEDVTTSEGWSFEYTYTSIRTGNAVTGISPSSITYAILQQNGGLAVRIRAYKS